MNISPSEYENVTPLYFRLRLEGMRNLLKQQYISDMERTRKLACILLTPHLKKSAKADPQIIWPFSWDKKQKMNPKQLVDFVSSNKKIFDKLRL